MTSTTPVRFRDVCTVTADSPGSYTGIIDPVWTIGPKVHGGTIVAGCAAAALAELRTAAAEVAAGMLPVATSTDFLGAPDPGEVGYHVSIRKTGRQICLADTELRQNGRLLARTAVTFGHLDEAEPVYPLAAPDLPAEPTADAYTYDADSPLAAIVHVSQGCELRLDAASAPLMEGKQGEPAFRLWARPFAGDAENPDVAALFAIMLTDISPPVPMNLGKIGWAPTVQLTTYLRRRPAPGWLRILSSTHTVGARLFDEDHMVVDSTGALVAQSRQLAMLPR